VTDGASSSVAFKYHTDELLLGKLLLGTRIVGHRDSIVSGGQYQRLIPALTLPSRILDEQRSGATTYIVLHDDVDPGSVAPYRDCRPCHTCFQGGFTSG
jgi:hypothetical protein